MTLKTMTRHKTFLVVVIVLLLMMIDECITANVLCAGTFITVLQPRTAKNFTCLVDSNYRYKTRIFVGNQDSAPLQPHRLYIYDHLYRILLKRELSGWATQVQGTLKAKGTHKLTMVLVNDDSVRHEISVRYSLVRGLSQFYYVMVWIGSSVGFVVCVYLFFAFLEKLGVIGAFLTRTMTRIRALWNYVVQNYLTGYMQYIQLQAQDEVDRSGLSLQELIYDCNVPKEVILRILQFHEAVVEHDLVMSYTKMRLEKSVMSQLFGRFQRTDDRRIHLLYTHVDFTAIDADLSVAPHVLRLRDVKSLKVNTWYDNSWNTRTCNPKLKVIRDLHTESIENIYLFIDAARNLSELYCVGCKNSDIIQFMKQLRKLRTTFISIEDVKYLHQMQKLVYFEVQDVTNMLLQSLIQNPTIKHFKLTASETLNSSSWLNLDPDRVERLEIDGNIFGMQSMCVPLYGNNISVIKLGNNAVLDPKTFSMSESSLTRSSLEVLSVKEQMPSEFFYNLTRFPKLREVSLNLSPEHFSFIKLLSFLKTLEVVDLRSSTTSTGESYVIRKNEVVNIMTVSNIARFTLFEVLEATAVLSEQGEKEIEFTPIGNGPANCQFLTDV